MLDTRLYSEVVSGSSGSEDFELQKRPRGGSLVNWLSEYQTESEEVAVKKALEMSKKVTRGAFFN